MNIRTMEDVIGRMYNWKMTSAYAFAVDTPNFPPEALAILKKMCDEYGNCGWQDGNIYEPLREANHKVAAILGYRWDDERDQWIKNDDEDTTGI